MHTWVEYHDVPQRRCYPIGQKTVSSPLERSRRSPDVNDATGPIRHKGGRGVMRQLVEHHAAHPAMTHFELGTRDEGKCSV
jgi:hypothetical protein